MHSYREEAIFLLGKQGWYWGRMAPHCEHHGILNTKYKYFYLLGKWVHNHTELDCDKACMAENMYLGALKISTFCCKGEDFCNKYHGQVVNKNIY